jgi:hypothetical protein
LASGLLAWGSALGFLVIARITVQGTQTGGARLAFATFWMAAAAVAGAQGARSLAGYFGFDSFAVIRALDETATPAYCIAAAALVYYVAFVRTGRAVAAVPIGLYYLAMIPFLRYNVEAAHPIGYVVEPWQVNLVYEQPLQTPLYTVALVATALPAIVAVLAYLALLWETPETPARYRLALVGLGLLLWVGTEVVAWATGRISSTHGELARRSIGIAVTLSMLLAYYPPEVARRKWGAMSVA